MLLTTFPMATPFGDPGRGYGLGATVRTALLGIGTPDAPGFDFPNTDAQYSRSAAQAYALDSKGSNVRFAHSFARERSRMARPRGFRAVARRGVFKGYI
jgi:hypothetical protein